ncbi:MAG: RES family NAD+ phosphorylase [Opitutaceae bacterium]
MGGALPEPGLAPFFGGDFFRIIPSRFPPISIYEAIYESAEELEIAYALEAMTNPRTLEEAGDLNLVPVEERVTGAGASIVMAPFTHLSAYTRFSDGSFGVYYAAKSLETAIEETKYHRARFLAATEEADQEITMRVYSGGLKCRLSDLRPELYAPVLKPDSYEASQAFAREQKGQGANGLLYPSVRHEGGHCVAVFRPKALAIPKQRMHLKYVYSKASQSISHVYEARML